MFALSNMKNIMSIDNKGKNLSNARFFISENLTPMNSNIAFECQELRKADFFQNMYTVDGILYVSRSRVEKKVMEIFYESALLDLFPEYNF